MKTLFILLLPFACATQVLAELDTTGGDCVGVWQIQHCRQARLQIIHSFLPVMLHRKDFDDETKTNILAGFREKRFTHLIFDGCDLFDFRTSRFKNECGDLAFEVVHDFGGRQVTTQFESLLDFGKFFSQFERDYYPLLKRIGVSFPRNSSQNSTDNNPRLRTNIIKLNELGSNKCEVGASQDVDCKRYQYGIALKWTPKVGQRGTDSINTKETVTHVQETTSA